MATTTRDGLKNVRAILKRLSTPLLPDDYTQLVHPLWSARELRGQIVSAKRHHGDTVSLTIRPGWAVPVDFEAGQFIGIGVQIDGRYTWRSYSLTCTPKPAGDLLTITVRAVERGKMSNHLVGLAQPGMQVRLAAPAGDFHLTDPVPDKVLFITAGTGLTPVVSMLKTMDERNQFTDVVLIHSARGENRLLFAEELRQIAKRNDSFQLIIHDTATADRLTPSDIERLVPDVKERAGYACGPTALLNALEDWWEQLGADYPLRTERFVLDRSNAATGGVVTLGHRGEIEVDGSTTLLEAGEKAGVQMTFGCRMGICQTCVRPLVDGEVIDLRTGDSHGPGERIRTCVTVACGDVTVDC